MVFSYVDACLLHGLTTDYKFVMEFLMQEKLYYCMILGKIPKCSKITPKFFK